MANSLIPLSELHKREEGAVVELHGGSHLVSRLATLGFTPGAPLIMIQNVGHGPVLVRVREARIALGRREAHEVYVRRRSS